MPTITDGAPLAPFPFNSLLAILDKDGNDTGSRCYYVGLSADRNNRLTGEAHVSLCDRDTLKRSASNINLPIYILRLASTLPSPRGRGVGGEGRMSADIKPIPSPASAVEAGRG